jgi:hypothetical protein
MNYRRKKISMKERLEEAIEEIGEEPLQGSGFECETPEEGFGEIEPGSAELRQPHDQATVGTQFRHVEIPRTAPEPSSAMPAKSRLIPDLPEQRSARIPPVAVSHLISKSTAANIARIRKT